MCLYTWEFTLKRLTKVKKYIGIAPSHQYVVSVLRVRPSRLSFASVFRVCLWCLSFASVLRVAALVSCFTFICFLFLLFVEDDLHLSAK